MKKKKQYEVTFILNNGEIGHLIEASSLVRARDKIMKHFVDDLSSPVIAISDDLVIIKQNIQYFKVHEYDFFEEV
ncbi:hypothetical protein [Cytobacillus gottheilii]|uniref:DUF3906 family protein n=1 Tax=Cytobacillus gottheilii TaxID=859144 RepID=A0ABX8FF51_9BACI|nr:hypothetical protein [Cytobacillus gottheilii]QVY62642.1 hypothetical protein J1899_06155 [Cytobacillus gottheilii]